MAAPPDVRTSVLIPSEPRDVSAQPLARDLLNNPFDRAAMALVLLQQTFSVIKQPVHPPSMDVVPAASAARPSSNPTGVGVSADGPIEVLAQLAELQHARQLFDDVVSKIESCHAQLSPATFCAHSPLDTAPTIESQLVSGNDLLQRVGEVIKDLKKIGAHPCTLIDYFARGRQLGS